MKLLGLFMVFICQFNLTAQDNGQWKTYPGANDSSKVANEKIKNFNLNFSGKSGEVKVTKDEKIQALTEFAGTPQKNEPGVKIKGFRVQLFFDADKDAVNQKRSDYLARHNDHPAYVDYLQPNFRLRCGNFRTKLQAQYWANELVNDFPDAIIVEDWIELPELKQDEKK